MPSHGFPWQWQRVSSIQIILTAHEQCTFLSRCRGGGLWRLEPRYLHFSKAPGNCPALRTHSLEIRVLCSPQWPFTITGQVSHSQGPAIAFLLLSGQCPQSVPPCLAHLRPLPPLQPGFRQLPPRADVLISLDVTRSATPASGLFF